MLRHTRYAIVTPLRYIIMMSEINIIDGGEERYITPLPAADAASQPR